jgi:hypothetical protein
MSYKKASTLISYPTEHKTRRVNAQWGQMALAINNFLPPFVHFTARQILNSEFDQRI